MSNILKFKIPFQEPPPLNEKTLILNKIKRLASWLFYMVVVIFIMTALASLFLITQEKFHEALSIPSTISWIKDSLSIHEWIIVSLLTMIKPLAFCPILWGIYQLAKLFKQGVIFTIKNSDWFQFIGFAMIAFDVILFIRSIIVGPLLSYLKITEPYISIHFGSTFFIIGVFIIVIARVMKLGHLIEKEQEYTV